ncbi:MAG TPA: prevent-host-death protein [Verrucomicrobiae bacterium]|nr:prevent-host-death protein [Verrucomicrobiae bacterium]
MKKVALNRIQSELPKFLRLAVKEEVVITDKGKPAGVLIGFESEDDWFDYQLENDARFLRRIKSARRSLRAGKGTRLEDLQHHLDTVEAHAVREGVANYRTKGVKKKLRLK